MDNENTSITEDITSVRAMSIEFDWKSIIKEIGLLKTIWGYDIFLNGVPFLKTLVLLNIIVWIVLIGK